MTAETATPRQPTWRRDIPELGNPVWLHAEHWTAGRSLQDMADGLGCARETVAVAMRAARVPIRTRHATPKTERTAEEIAAAKADAHRRKEATRMSNPREAEAREAQVADAARILADPSVALTDRQREVLAARVAYPKAPLSVLANAVGVGKGAYSATLTKVLRGKVPAVGVAPGG